MKRKKIVICILSLIYSLFILIGNSFLIKGSFKMLISYPILSLLSLVLLFVIFYFVLNKLFTNLDENNYHFKLRGKIYDTKIFKLFYNHPFLFSFVFIIICWLPYIIAYYPVILSPDPSFQIRQYFGIDTKYSTYSILIDPNVLITNHHPVIHTLLLGTCVKIGTLINNVNLGLFIYSIIQILILASTLSYTIKFMKDIKVNKKYILLVLIIYSFVPVFPFYAMSAVKDVIFGSLVILYTITLYKIVKKDEFSTKDMIKEIILMILVILFRNNGIYVLLLSFPFVLFLKKKYFKKLILILILILSFNASYNKIILPYFKITSTSVREMLSIPFQQTARYVKEHSNEVTKEEEKVIDKILVYDTLASRYNPDLADPVKNKFNRFYSKDDLNKYFKVWFKQLKNHPITYIEATINNTYGYIYPLKTNWYIYCNFDKRITENGFDYHFNNLNTFRTILSTYGIIFPYIPILGLTVNIAFNTWILLFMSLYVLYRKKYKNLIYLLPSLIVLLVCFASPANTYFRYALPYIFMMPLLIGIFTKEK